MPKIIILLFSLFPFSYGVFAQKTITLPALQDNAIYEGEGLLSNGSGPYMMTGKNGDTNPVVRRALIKFDIAGNVPAGATIIEASLTLYLQKAASKVDEVTISLHRLTSDWGEGSSVAGNIDGNEGNGEANGAGKAAKRDDATWDFAFFHNTEENRTPWNQTGGDFASTASSSLSIDKTVGDKTWTGLVGDVQSMLDDPTNNFGWILIGDEENKRSMRKFRSREHTENLPALSITYEEGSTTIGKGLASAIKGPFPNPATDFLGYEIALENPMPVDIQIYNLLGERVFQEKDILGNKKRVQGQIPVSAFPQGIYFVAFISPKEQYISKLHIVR